MFLSGLLPLNTTVNPFERAMNWETEEQILLDEEPSAVELDADLNPKKASSLHRAYESIMEPGTTNFSPLSNLIARIISLVEALSDALENLAMKLSNYSFPTTTQPQNRANEQFVDLKGGSVTLFL